MEGKDLLMLLLCNYYVTYRCNAFCSFCRFGDHDLFRESTYAQRKDFENNISELASLGVKFIDLTGGEPLLHREIDLFAAYAKSCKMQTSITTNTLLYPKWADKLAGKIDLLHFSLDSPDEDEHNSIRKVNCYRSVMNSIEIALSLDEYPDLLFTVTEETYPKLPAMHKIASSYGIILLVNPVFSYFGNPGLSDKALDYIQSYSEGKKDIYLNKAFIKIRKDGGNKTDAPSCKAVSRVIVISPGNEIILPCYHLGNKYIKIDKPVRTIRQSPEFLYYRNMEGKFSFCEGCSINCYLEPSFAFPINSYSIISLSSKFKYSYNKLIKQKLRKFKSSYNKRYE